ncbi:hypothetical protein GCM10009416_14810 [Craurococcus roseus]|uniref:Uncharacterized protein n=1 Tax=Craurococcus roseus TaxID=77585 RepID=A0ABP3PW87_9PROT
MLTPATDDQVRRLGMQRRIFLVRGEPFVAARDGFFETWGTLAALIEAHRPAAPTHKAEADAAPGPGHDVRSGAEPPPGPTEPETEQGRRGAAVAPRRRDRAPRRRPAPADADAAPAIEAGAGPSEAEETLAGVAAAQTGAPGARVVRQWRAGQPPTPRWMVAGKARRGRLK